MPKKRLVSLLLMLLLLCAGGYPSAAADIATVVCEPGSAVAGGGAEGFPELPRFARDAAAFRDATFHEDAAEGDQKVRIDLSACHLGYVAISVTSDKRFKIQVIHGETTYTYNIRSDGTPSIFPLQSGDGEYTFRAMENVEGKKYAQALILTRQVTLDDPFQPFLRPNDYSKYSRDSLCVQEAADIVRNAKDQVEIVSAIYAYISKTIRYDHNKAATVKSGYLPDPDDTLRTKKGICFDYASLAAAMLRSQGVPCKVIFGYVAPNQLYHAWNMFYTEETGWVTVSFKANGKDWNRMDLTFTANGKGDDFIGDGSNYSDLYYY